MDWNKEKALDMAGSRIINYSGTTLCDNYRTPLERCESAAQALRLYKNCISWALQERYPTKAELLSFIGKKTLADNGVYIDTVFNGERIDDHVCCVFIGCSGRISTGLNMSKRIIPMLYLSEGSSLHIDVDDVLLSPLPVELFYGSSVCSDTPDRLRIKDSNGLTAADNVGFGEDELNVAPNLNNEEL